jgi:hypothetical protein
LVLFLELKPSYFSDLYEPFIECRWWSSTTRPLVEWSAHRTLWEYGYRVDETEAVGGRGSVRGRRFCFTYCLQSYLKWQMKTTKTFFRLADISLDSNVYSSNRSAPQLSYVARRWTRSKALHVTSTNLHNP